MREDLLVKVLGGANIPTQILTQEVKRRRQIHLEQMQQFQAIEACHQTNSNPSIQEQYRYLTLCRDLRYEQDWINWCDEVLAFLKQQIQAERQLLK